MKYIIFLSNLLVFNLLSVGSSSAQAPGAPGTTTKFKVYGNCGMCEKRIEKAARIKGVSLADWDVDTKILTVHFDENKAKPGKIHEAVAAVGHDTEKVRAKDKTYAKLHSCCQYERAMKQ